MKDKMTVYQNKMTLVYIVDALNRRYNMQKKFLLAIMIFITAGGAFAVPSLEESFPQSYVALRDAVYSTVKSESEIASLYTAAVQDANATYTGSDLYTLLALCDYMKGMDCYYKKQNKKAGALFDSGIEYIAKARAIKDTAIAISAYTKLLLQNASVKSMAYQLKWVPKITGLCDQAISLNRQYTPAWQMKYAILCFIPAPYGNYKEGSAKMLSLNDEKWKKEKDDYFSIASAAAYAYSKSNQKAKAIEWYKKALEYYPTNSDALKSLSDLQD